jgi:hypothetical protein
MVVMKLVVLFGLLVACGSSAVPQAIERPTQAQIGRPPTFLEVAGEYVDENGFRFRVVTDERGLHIDGDGTVLIPTGVDGSFSMPGHYGAHAWRTAGAIILELHFCYWNRRARRVGA